MVNPYNKYIKQYQTNNITTATPEKLMIMLFDGAVQFLQKAKIAIEVSKVFDTEKDIVSKKILKGEMKNGRKRRDFRSNGAYISRY